MQTAVLESVTVVATDFSLWALFMRADIVVKVVMVGLILASLWSWTIMFGKFFAFRRVSRLAGKFELMFWSGENLQALYRDSTEGLVHPMGTVFNTAMREYARVEAGRNFSHDVPMTHMIERVLASSIGREMEALEKRLSFLATVGAVAPFVGLFGTVWGIMNSFQAIAVTRDTNLAVVAPGIAEALFATGLGLLAAIPAVIAYNKFSGDLTRFGARLDFFADDFLTVISRQKQVRSQ